MLVATFGPSTGWLGKTITFENECFNLEGHGPIRAVDVLEYDRQGHLTWAYEGLREWVESSATGSQQQHAVDWASRTPAIVPSPAKQASAAAPAASSQRTQAKPRFSKRWLLLAGLGLVIVVAIVAIAVPRLLGNPRKTQKSGTTQNLYEVVFADASHGWVSGGPSLTTSDGGKSWAPSGSKVWGMSFIDASRGWGLHGTGEALVVVATTDGGATWTQQGTQTIEFLPSALTFADEMHGWIVGMNGSILVTRDGGVTWTSQTSGTTGSLEGVDFVDPVHGWAVGGLLPSDVLSDAGIMLATQDGGTTWTTQDTGFRATLKAVTFADASRGWAVGFDYLEDTSVILDTHDGGSTWNAQEVGSMGQELIGIAFGDPDHGYAVGSEDDKRGVVYATSDGGVTWVEQAIPDSPALYTVSCFGEDHAWVVGDHGTILSTASGAR